jgi:hypothetical protein
LPAAPDAGLLLSFHIRGYSSLEHLGSAHFTQPPPSGYVRPRAERA